MDTYLSKFVSPIHFLYLIDDLQISQTYLRETLNIRDDCRQSSPPLCSTASSYIGHKIDDVCTTVADFFSFNTFTDFLI